MNKQELKEQIKKLSIDQNGLSYDKGNVSGVGPSHKIGTLKVLRLINQFEEPEKVVVPQFVAEWIECARKEHLSLNQAMNYYLRPDEVEKWLQYAVNQDLFARAWLDGYVVEREKLYTVEIPNPHHDGIIVLEKVGDDVIMSQMDDYLTDWRKGPEYQLTESEIRKDFEWAWQAGFAKEVE